MELDWDTGGNRSDAGNRSLNTMLRAALLAIRVGGFFAWNVYESGSTATAVLVVQSR
jgi:hypothetical protein